MKIVVNHPVIVNNLYIDAPPAKKRPESSETNKAYEIYKRIYSQKLKLSLADKRFSPLDLTIRRAFDFHSQSLIPEDKIIKVGYINLESQKTSDNKLINLFHSYKNINYSYGNIILGLNLHTKGSLDAGIELADFISYVSCQTLRFSHRLSKELLDVPNNRYDILKRLRREMSSRISLVDVTTDEF